MKLPLSRIAQFLGCSEGASVAGELTASGYSIDSRTIQPGELFFAVKGEKMDGHDFVAQAIEKGAIAAVICIDGIPSGPRATYFENGCSSSPSLYCAG